MSHSLLAVPTPLVNSRPAAAPCAGVPTWEWGLVAALVVVGMLGGLAMLEGEIDGALRGLAHHLSFRA
jgi:Flp pilus assembly pilin Flp